MQFLPMAMLVLFAVGVSAAEASMTFVLRAGEKVTIDHEPASAGDEGAVRIPAPSGRTTLVEVTGSRPMRLLIVPGDAERAFSAEERGTLRTAGYQIAETNGSCPLPEGNDLALIASRARQMCRMQVAPSKAGSNVMVRLATLLDPAPILIRVSLESRTMEAIWPCRSILLASD